MLLDLKKLLQKYDVPGPRYTSYPTVPAWTEAVRALDYQSSLAILKKGEKLSLYFHLPYCENLCHFCGCMQVITKDRSRSKEYVGIVISEVDRVLQNILLEAREVNQLHFGGGSPNFFQPEELTQIVQHVCKNFTMSDQTEIAIEMHPRTSTRAFCDNLKTLGFNRISLGVQDFDPKVQKLINRNQTYEMTKDMVDYLRGLGFESFNFDMVYGLPGQSLEGWKRSLKQVIGMRPNRLAVYSYAHVPWVRPVQRTFKDSDIPSPEMKLAFFEEAYKAFTANGYHLIGMDHFALENDELSHALKKGTIHRNFMGYSTRKDAHQLGFGVSAISYVGGNYFQNAKKIQEYIQKIQEEGLATFRGFLLQPDDKIRKAWITQIMCNGKVDFKAFESQWGICVADYFKEDLPKLAGFVKDGLLEMNDNELLVIGEGYLFLRNIAMQFDPYLEGINEKSQTPTFSRTV